MRKTPRISQLMVLESNAGFYIGRVEYDEDGDMNPYDRKSMYFGTKEAAESALINKNWIEYYG